MSYSDILQDTLDALQFKEDGITQIQSNVDAVTYGLVTTVIAGLASSIGQLNPIGLVAYPIGLLLSMVIGTGIFHIFAKLFGGQGSYRDLFSVLSNAQLITWITVVPILGPILSTLIGLYMIPFNVFAIKEVYNLSVGKSIAVFLLPAIIFGVIAILLAVLFVGSILGGLGLGALA